ncbi:DUF6950 family protein [Pseudooceanicola sp.]|uniref:DUF6950 family protein n=1 Tax=Pseudooceanicola sp. TaxID=1914328 RepID=UPI0040587CCC
MTPVYAELNRWMATPFTWESANCWFVLGDWIKTVRGVDPAAGDRFTFEGMGECQRVTAYFSDPIGTVDARMSAAGISRGNSLCMGDVALIRVADQSYPVGALWTGDCWGCKGPSGVTTIRPDQADLLAFWSIGYEA